jgi:hypothetical protein
MEPIVIEGIMLSNYAMYGVAPEHSKIEYKQSAYFTIMQHDGECIRCAVIGEPTRYQELAGGKYLLRFIGLEYRNIGALKTLIVDPELTGTGILK